MASLARRLLERLRAARASDGGLGPRPGAASEPEPTALMALATGDADAREWLRANQYPDGSFVSVPDDDVWSDSATALAALALGPSEEADRAVDYLVATRAPALHTSDALPIDPTTHGWPWTRDTSGWVEPSARALLALRTLRPSAEEAIADAIALLRDRECRDGGWNYGNRLVLGTFLPPYAQTTAAALIALQGAEPDLYKRGLRALRTSWRHERGGLSLAMTLAALRLAGDPETAPVAEALDELFRRTAFMDDIVAIAWAAIASGTDIETIRVRA